MIDLETAREYSAQKSLDTVFMGTAAFSPPEQFGYSQTDIRSDIYSIGSVLSYLATKNTNLHSLDSLDFSNAFKKCIHRCVSFDPEKRYPSVHMLQKDLLQLTPEKTLLSYKRKYRYYSLACTLLSLTCIILLFFLKETNSPHSQTYHQR